MNLRQTKERLWGVWVYNDHSFPAFWEPYDEGYTSRRAAEKALRLARAKYEGEDERFDLVETVNVRQRVPEKRSTAAGGATVEKGGSR